MSKKSVLHFLTKAAEDDQLRTQLNDATDKEEMATVARQVGYDFKPQHIDEAIEALQQQPGFFGMLAEAALELFSPNSDNYPATGVQPYSGQPNSKS